MQSARRKRERVENDAENGDSSTRRGSKSQKKQEIGIGVANDKAAAEVTPQLSEDNSSKSAARQAQLSPSAATATEGTNGGNDESETITVPTAMGTSNDRVQSTAAPGEASTFATSKGGLFPRADAGTREQQILALISHRKILLERMKQCKSAAGSRLQQNVEKREQTKESCDKVSIDGKQQSSQQVDSDSEEVQSYRRTCRKANEANRKQKTQASEAATEKRSSVSLRRGSSVGKRMNAALSTLGASSSFTPTDPNAKVHLSVGSVSESQQDASLPGIQMHMPNSKHAPHNSSQQRVVPMKSSSSVTNSAASLPMNQKYGGGQQGRKRSSAAHKAVKSYQGSSSSTNAVSSSALPLHEGTATSGLPFNRLAYTKVNFPEARALRENRDAIRTKLNAMIHERLERIKRTRSQPKSYASQTNKPSPEEYRLALPRMVLERNVNAPSKLPRRQKTHWDYLLEEMRWLATDFVEERKWKAASARTLASATAANRLNAVAPAVAAHEQKMTTGSQGNEVVSESQAEESKSTVTASTTKCVPEILQESLEDVGGRSYFLAGSSDRTLARSAANIISDMVAELWTGAIECGTLATTEPLISALKRHEKLREAVVKDQVLDDSEQAVAGEGTSICELDDDKENGSETDLTEAQKVVSLGEGDRETASKGQEDSNLLSNEEISERIASASDRVKSRTVRRNRATSSKDTVPLGVEQRKALDFVEFVWGRNAVIAPCLNGPASTGKTFLSCYIFWRRRSEGPQLLVCSPARLVRWVYELGRFKELKLYIFGQQCGLSSAVSQASARSSFQAGDVLVCEFSSLRWLIEETQEANLGLAAFQTVVVDVRFPTENTAKVEEGNSSRRRTSTVHIPPEMVSHSWWASLLNSLRPSSAQRLLIDNYECTLMRESGSLDHAELTERQRLDSLAAMAAFVVGPDLFRCDNTRSIQHKVVSWARHSAKEGRTRRRPRYDEVLGVIVDAAFPFRYVLNSEAMDDSERREEDEWDVRLCPLSTSQRSAYEACCIGVRGSLAFGNITDYADSRNRPEHYEHAVQGLMKLRRVCVHSRVDDILESSTSGLEGATLPNRIVNSVSQPQADMASVILSGSSKLRELVTILVEDCGFSVAEDSVIMHSKEIEQGRATRKRAKKKQQKKKVAILAMLPEVQLLTSMMLTAIGINHELLGWSKFRNLGNVATSSAPLCGVQLDTTLVWIEAQLSLLRFSSTHPFDVDDDDSSTVGLSNLQSSCDVIITSPVLVGAENGGLGIEAADVVICIDEDWSGRDRVLSERILNRACFAQEMMADGDRKRDGGRIFVRLVSEKTCEHIFLSDFDDGGDDVTEVGENWSTDSAGLLTPPTEPQAFDVPSVDQVREPGEDAIEGRFRFPGSIFLRFRGAVLSTVLLPASHIPPVFATGEPIRFLPFKEWEETGTGTSSVSVELVRSLIAEEDRCRRLWTRLCYPVSQNRIDESRKDCDGNAISTPLPADSPDAFITRHDMIVMASRIYVDRFGKLIVETAGPGMHPIGSSCRLAGPSAYGTENSAISATGENFDDPLHKSGQCCKPVDMVPSLLSYGPSDVLQRATITSTNETTADGRNEDMTTATPHSISITRANAFSASYSSSRSVVSNIVHDGNQGVEPLAYFPPLFPSLLAASERAKSDAAHRRTFPGRPMASAFADHNYLPTMMSELDAGPLKRKEHPVSYTMTVASKRPRFAKVLGSVETAQPLPFLPSERPGAEAVPFTKPASSLKEEVQGISSSVQYANEAEKCSKATDSSIVTEDEGSQWDHFDIGALPADGESPRHASALSVNALGYARWRDPYEASGLDHEIFSSTISCDAEEVEAKIHGESEGSFLDSMLLFVAKQAPAVYAGMSASSAGTQVNFSSTNTQWSQSRSQLPIPGPAITAVLPNGLGPDGTDVNGAGPGKKGKRKNQSQSTVSVGAFARVNPMDMSKRSMNPYIGGASMHAAKGRESYRSKVLANILARQGGGRETLFQVPSFLLASIRIRDDVLRRVLSQSQGSPPGGSRVSYSGALSWTRACYKLSSSAKKTGDCALKMSKEQRNKMSTAPGPVDFGPFVAGYIASSYAICGALPRSSVPGIALPMGVKISPLAGKQQSQGWTDTEDNAIKESVLRRGLNWHLVAAAVNDLDGKGMQHDSAHDNRTTVLSSRSPEQCHERWNWLVQDAPSLLDELRNSERARHLHAVKRPTQDDVDCDSAHRLTTEASPCAFLVGKAVAPLSLLPPSSLIVEEDDNGEQNTHQEETSSKTQMKHSFAAVRRAAKKRIEVSLPIPGSVDGGKPTLVPSHPSHTEAVQVVASSSGREVWPLQVLEMADKQRAATAKSVSSGPSPRRQASPNRQQRLPQSFQVPHSAMAPVLPSPSRSPQAQAFPGVSSSHGGPVSRGTPLRGPSAAPQSRST